MYWRWCDVDGPVSVERNALRANITETTQAYALDTVYQNTTGRPLLVCLNAWVNCNTSSSAQHGRIDLDVSASNPPAANQRKTLANRQTVTNGAFDSVQISTRVEGGLDYIVLPNHFFRWRTISVLGTPNFQALASHSQEL